MKNDKKCLFYVYGMALIKLSLLQIYYVGCNATSSNCSLAKNWQNKHLYSENIYEHFIYAQNTDSLINLAQKYALSCYSGTLFYLVFLFLTYENAVNK